jgi:class 3 adenylate cyclase/tetratricopeptide (TPR) repeat protein
MNQCVECGAETPAEDRFCSNCGVEMRRECPVCDTPATPEARFCASCGAAFGLSQGLTEASESGRPPEVTERRLVTALFADLVEFTSRSEQRDPEEVASFLGDYFESARDVIDRFGGVVEKFAGDAVMAVWGADVAHEDDAERAVRAGLELQQAVAGLAVDVGDPDLGLRVGILTGEAAVRLGADASTGMIAGDLMNSASRLQNVADPGTVLVGEATHRAAHRAIAFEEAGTPSLKGKQQPIATWRALRVIAERGGRGRVEGLDPPFVGRRAELRLLKDLLAVAAGDRRARMVSIVGEVGIGKSRLVWELQKYADGLAVPVSWNQGRSLAYGTEGVASWALSDMLRGRIGVTEGDEDALVAAALDASLDEVVGDPAERARLRQWLGPLLCCGPAPDGDRSEFDAAIRSYFGSMAAYGTTVLVFEDLQWADAGLLDLVEDLAAWMPDAPVLVLALTRPELLERRPGWASGRSGVVSLRLGPLADDEMGQLLDEMMGKLEPRLRTDIIERAAGVPLYAVELARSLMARGLIGRANGTSTAPTDLSDIALPETLQSLIGARIDRLALADRSILQDAAILGGSFTLPALAAISGQSEGALAARLEEFVDQELIEPVRDARSPTRGGFRFVQELVCEVARNRMSREVRRSRHVAAARYVESLAGPDSAVVAADHYLSALSIASPGAEADALRDQATDVLLSAFDRAVELYANDEVLSLGSRIHHLELDLPLDRRVAIEEQMAIAASALARFEEAQRHIESAIALSRRLGDEALLRHAVALAAEIYLDHHKTRRALDLLEKHLEGIDDFSTDPDLAGLVAQLARAKAQDGDDDAALAAAERALSAGEEFRLMPVIGDALTTKAMILDSRGRRLEARALFETVIDLAERENLPQIGFGVYLDMSLLPEDDLTEDPSLAAIEQGRRIGNVNYVLMASGNRVESLMMRGRWEETEQLLADPLWESARDTVRAEKLLLLARKEAFQGDIADAKANLKAALDSLDREAGTRSMTIANEEAAIVRAVTGDTATALDWAEHALEQPESIPWLEPLVIVLLLAGDRRRVEDLAAICVIRRHAFDWNHRRFVRSLVAVRADDAASLSAAEALIAEAASRGRVADELIWTIGLGRWLPEGDADRTRLMARARNRIDESGFVGLAHFLDP